MLNTAHGNSNTYWQLNNLILELEGSFNLEGVQTANQKLKYAVNNSLFDSWFLIIKLAPETLLTSDSFDEVSSIMDWSSRHNCQYVAYITEEIFYESFIERMFRGISLPYKFFDTIESALEWLEIKKQTLLF